MSTTFAELDTQERQRLLDKLAKLKALSECKTGNVNETATAAATMTRIMLEYEIEIADLEMEGEGEGSELLDQPIVPDSYNGFPLWQKNILSALAEVNHCMSYTSHDTDYDMLWIRRTRTRLSVIGSSRDVENTRQMFVWCVEEVERLCRDWGHGMPQKRRNDFKRGAGSGIADKVRKERDQVIQEERERAAGRGLASTALELFDRKERAVAEVARRKGLRTVTKRVRSAAADAWQAGYAAGASMNLSGNRPKALPAPSQQFSFF